MTPEHTAAALVAGIVTGVALLAFLPKPRWLDRIWLGMIAVSFVLYVPMWIGFQIQDHGWKAVAIGIGGLFVAGFIRGLPSTSRETPFRADSSKS
jgi:hypothetical protein